MIWLFVPIEVPDRAVPAFAADAAQVGMESELRVRAALAAYLQADRLEARGAG